MTKKGQEKSIETNADFLVCSYMLISYIEISGSAYSS